MNKICIALLFAILTSHSQTLQELFYEGKNHIQKKEYGKALACYKKLYKHFPHDHNIIHITGYLMRRQNHMQQAMAFYETVLPQFPQSPQLNLGYTFACLSCGEYQKAWPSYEYRWKEPPAYNAIFRNYFRSHSITGKRILLKTEFGLGDSMQFIRYAYELKKLGAHIIVECHPALEKLFLLCGYIDEVVVANQPLPPFDFQTQLMSLPYVFNTNLETIPNSFPYLYAQEKLVAFWKEKIKHDTNLKVGICWSTDLVSPDQIINDEKSNKNIPLSLFAQLHELPNISLYSLQKNINQANCKKYNITYFDNFDTTNGSFMDSAALIANLDLVITMDTSIAHLAGAMNKPTWILLPFQCDWRWLLSGNTTNWYPTMQLFRQTKPGDWHSVMNTVIKELKKIQAK